MQRSVSTIGRAHAIEYDQMSTARRAERADDLRRGVELRRVGSKPADCEINIRNGVGVVVLGTRAKIDSDDHHAHRGEGLVHECVFISTNVLTHPSSAMNIQDGRERAWALGLVDGRLERLPVYLQVVDISRVESHRLTGQTQCARRGCGRERRWWLGGRLATPGHAQNK